MDEDGEVENTLTDLTPDKAWKTLCKLGPNDYRPGRSTGIGLQQAFRKAWDTKYPDDAAMVPNPAPDPADPLGGPQVWAAFFGRERCTTASATVGSRRHDLGLRGHGGVAGQHQHNRKGGHVGPRTKLEVLPDQWWHPGVQEVREERIRDSVRTFKKRRTGLSI
jgi:hypothetical protein